MSRGLRERGQVVAEGAPDGALERWMAIVESVGVDSEECSPTGGRSIAMKAGESLRRRATAIAERLHVLPGAVHRTAMLAGLEKLEGAIGEEVVDDTPPGWPWSRWSE